MRGEANKTISTVRMTMSRSLAFLADPALAACRHSRTMASPSTSPSSCAKPVRYT